MLTCQAASPDIVRQGAYEIHRCGDQVHKVKKLLQYTHDTLSQLIQDLDYPSIPREKALNSFMNGVPVSKIKTMFQHIVDGSKVSFGALPGSPPELAGPRIVCIDPHTDASKGFAGNCQKNPNVAAFSVNYSPYIVLCPRFSLLPLHLGFWDCPMMDRKDPERMTNMHHSQFAILVHELIHFYYTKSQILHPEIYSPNKMMKLPPGEAQWNPSNWGWLVSRKSLQVSTFVGNSTMRTIGRG